MKQQGFTTLVIVILGILSAYGWVANIVKLAMTPAVAILEFGAMEILRVIGVFVVPLGVALGFI